LFGPVCVEPELGKAKIATITKTASNESNLGKAVIDSPMTTRDVEAPT